MCNSSGQYLEMILNLAYMHSSMNIYECFGATKPLTQMDWVIKSFKTCIFIQIITKTHEKKSYAFWEFSLKKTCNLKSSRMYEMLAIQLKKKTIKNAPIAFSCWRTHFVSWHWFIPCRYFISGFLPQFTRTNTSTPTLLQCFVGDFIATSIDLFINLVFFSSYK